MHDRSGGRDRLICVRDAAVSPQLHDTRVREVLTHLVLLSGDGLLLDEAVITIMGGITLARERDGRDMSIFQ
jgi:hypothetical protein